MLAARGRRGATTTTQSTCSATLSSAHPCLHRPQPLCAAPVRPFTLPPRVLLPLTSPSPLATRGGSPRPPPPAQTRWPPRRCAWRRRRGPSCSGPCSRGWGGSRVVAPPTLQPIWLAGALHRADAAGRTLPHSLLDRGHPRTLKWQQEQRGSTQGPCLVHARPT